MVPKTELFAAGAVMDTAGGVVSGAGAGVDTASDENAVLPAASRATAVWVYESCSTVVVFQEMEYVLDVSSGPRFALSSLNCTPTTPTLSNAVAATVMVPEAELFAAGAVKDTAGAVVSGGESVRK